MYVYQNFSRYRAGFRVGLILKEIISISVIQISSQYHIVITEQLREPVVHCHFQGTECTIHEFEPFISCRFSYKQLQSFNLWADVLRLCRISHRVGRLTCGTSSRRFSVQLVWSMLVENN